MTICEANLFRSRAIYSDESLAMNEANRTQLLMQKAGAEHDITELRRELAVDGVLLEGLAKALQNEPEALFMFVSFTRPADPHMFDAKNFDWLTVPTMQERIAKVEQLRTRIEDLRRIEAQLTDT